MGSIARYLIAVLFAGQFQSSFPYATFTANIAGCFMIGVVYALSDRGSWLSPDIRMFLTTGFCGGFTTFSTFTYESMRLLQDGELLYLGLNVLLTLVIGFACTYLGILLVRLI